MGIGLADRMQLFPGDTLIVISFENFRQSLMGRSPTMRTFEVTGTFATGMYDYDLQNVYTTLEAAQELLGIADGDLVSGVGVRTEDPELATVVGDEIQARLGFPYYVESWKVTNRALFSALKLEKLAMGLILFLIVLVAGLGTGGTLMGCARRLKEYNPKIRVVAVEPHPGDLVQGLRSLEEGFIPPILDTSLLDGKIIVESRCAFAATKDLTTKEAIFAGISSGAVIHCAIRVAHRMEKGTIVCVLCDGGWKYVSLGVWFKEIPNLGENVQSHIWW